MRLGQAGFRWPTPQKCGLTAMTRRCPGDYKADRNPRGGGGERNFYNHAKHCASNRQNCANDKSIQRP